MRRAAATRWAGLIGPVLAAALTCGVAAGPAARNVVDYGADPTGVRDSTAALWGGFRQIRC